MIHAYNQLYLNTVMRNIADLFDLAINEEGLNPEEFASKFATSIVARGIEMSQPNYLAGKSASELYAIICDTEPTFKTPSFEKSPEYWAGWILAYAQWSMDISFSKLLEAYPFSRIVSMYYPYHEADERKMVEFISREFSEETALKRLREMLELTQEQLAMLSGVKLRSIKAYEQCEIDIAKAQGETLLMLSRTLGCSMEDLIKKY